MTIMTMAWMLTAIGVSSVLAMYRRIMREAADPKALTRPLAHRECMNRRAGGSCGRGPDNRA
jgi:hypothetical protein